MSSSEDKVSLTKENQEFLDSLKHKNIPKGEYTIINSLYKTDIQYTDEYDIIDILNEELHLLDNEMFTVKIKDDPKEYVLRIIRPHQYNEEYLNVVINSFRSINDIIIKNCKYKNLFICIKDLFIYTHKRFDMKFIIYVYEKLPGVDLDIHLEKIDQIPFADFILISYRLLYALNILHINNIYHRDIKPGNVIYNENGTSSNFLKLIDFEYSCLKDTCKGQYGTNSFIAYDINESDNEKQDIKSALITIFKLYVYPKNLNTMFYKYNLDKKKYDINRSQLFSDLLAMLRKRNAKTGSIERNFVIMIYDYLCGKKYNSIEDILKSMQQILKGCIPKEILSI